MPSIDAPFATYSDVEDIWRPLSDAEQDVVSAWLSQAAVEIRSEVPTVDDRISAGVLDAAVPKMISARMVRRVMINPDGLRSFARSIDDYQRSGTFDTALSAGELYLTDRERRRLAGMPESAQSAFSIRLGPGPRFRRGC